MKMMAALLMLMLGSWAHAAIVVVESGQTLRLQFEFLVPPKVLGEVPDVFYLSLLANGELDIVEPVSGQSATLHVDGYSPSTWTAPVPAPLLGGVWAAAGSAVDGVWSPARADLSWMAAAASGYVDVVFGAGRVQFDSSILFPDWWAGRALDENRIRTGDAPEFRGFEILTATPAPMPISGTLALCLVGMALWPIVGVPRAAGQPGRYERISEAPNPAGPSCAPAARRARSS